MAAGALKSSRTRAVAVGSPLVLLLHGDVSDALGGSAELDGVVDVLVDLLELLQDVGLGVPHASAQTDKRREGEEEGGVKKRLLR
eukprot:436721-Hanusia_phi.AAC.1